MTAGTILLAGLTALVTGGPVALDGSSPRAAPESAPSSWLGALSEESLVSGYQLVCVISTGLCRFASSEWVDDGPAAQRVSDQGEAGAMRIGSSRRLSTTQPVDNTAYSVTMLAFCARQRWP